MTDEAILSRVLDETARKRLLYIDLTGYLDEWPGPILPGSVYEFASGGPNIYTGGEPLTISRFPNNVQNQAFLFADSAEALKERAEVWSPDAWKSMYAVVFMCWDWANSVFDVKSFSAETGELVTCGFWDVPQENPRFYVFNLLEEIDVPGESFIDYENKAVCFYPPEGFKEADIYLSVLQNDIIHQQQGFFHDGTAIKKRQVKIQHTKRASPHRFVGTRSLCFM